jgi:hypothetical protein
VTARATFGYIYIDFYHLDFNETAFDVYDGTYDCSEIFNITGANATDYDLSDLQCSAKDTSTSTVQKTRVKIQSSNVALLN